MTRALLPLAPIAVILLFGCSSSSSGSTASGDCTSPSKCSNDGPTPSVVVQICQAQLDDSKCGAQYAPLLKCSRTNQKCGADGKSTSALPPECKAENDAWTACLNASKKDGG